MNKAAVWVSGFIVGAVLSISSAAYGSGVLEKVDAYLRPDFKVSVDGAAASLEKAPLVYDGSTYLPVRELAELLGKDVKWEERTLTVQMESKSGKPLTRQEAAMRDYALSSGMIYTGDVARNFKYEGLSGIEYNGIEYFSRTEFMTKFRDSNNSRFKQGLFEDGVTVGIIFYDKAGKEVERVVTPGKEGFMVVAEDGSSWISTEYYPDEAPFRN
jgi:hypothetical protein